MIIGTAGHIDHGKTTLVRALTGVDTDRLPAEKARGISIELGYAYAPTRAGATLGFIDVPGHERLVHTMLAGASGIDFALLVVAADDGVMPQTKEHVAILDLLGVAHGAVAITKADRVDDVRLARVEADVQRLLSSTVLAGSLCYAVDARDAAGAGIAALRAVLERAAEGTLARRRDGLFRLCIDRAFSLAGHGTIATGTAQAGEIHVGDHVQLFPAGRSLRVRGMHAQNRPATVGYAGDRLALNLVGIDATDLRRGDWLADAQAVHITTRVDAHLTLLPGTAPLRPFAPVHLHYAAVHATAHVIGLGTHEVAPDRPGWVQLVFEAPVALAPGDRYIVRDAQAKQTLGGGVLVDPAAPARRRRGAARLALLDALHGALDTGNLAPLLAAAPWGYSRGALLRATGRAPAGASPPGVRVIAAGPAAEEHYFVDETHWAALADRTCATLEACHVQHPNEPGPHSASLRRLVDPLAPELLWRALVDELVMAGRVRRAGAWLQLPGHGAALTAREEADAAVLMAALVEGGYEPPWARDLATATGLDPARVRALLAGLGRAGRAYPVVADLYFDAGAVNRLAAVVAELATNRGGIDAAAFRDRIGIGRKRAIQILEFFDRVGYTRRTAAGRVLRHAGGWSGAQ